MASQRAAGAASITMRKAEQTWTPRNFCPPGCRRSPLGRVLHNLSTGFARAPADGPDHGIGHQLARERPGLNRGDDDLPRVRDLTEEGRAPLEVQLGQNIVEKEYGPLARAPRHQGRFSE